MTEYFTIFGIGALGYSLIELLWRGHTHWTMTLTGGLVFLIMYFINTKILTGGLLKRCFIGCGVITAIEFTVGYVVNIIFHMKVWNYSGVPFNIMGQICPRFTFLWFLLCIPVIPLCMYVKKHYFTFTLVGNYKRSI